MTTIVLDELTEVVDEFGHVYALGGLLGEGGQGAVYRSKAPHVALKILKSFEGPNADVIHDKLKQRLIRLRTLPIDDREVAKPVALLQGHLGYVMTLLSDMVPISVLINVRTGEAYRETGGLRRRLRVLERLAQALTRLHGVPLVYGDLSRNNVFVSQDVSFEEIRLIDADNLRFATGPGPSVYTPGYGAPEVIAQRGVTTLSDAYAFAVLAHEVLTLISPFDGALLDSVDAGWDADPVTDLRAAADRGEVPWVFDPSDSRNPPSAGLPHNRVMSTRMFKLFERTFGPGRLDPTQRPRMGEWLDTLRGAADRTVACPSCHMTFFMSRPTDPCPWCRSTNPPALLLAEAHHWDPEFDEAGAFGVLPSSAIRHVVGEGDLTLMRRHIFAPTVATSPNPIWLSVEFRPNGIRLNCLDDDANLTFIDPTTGQSQRLFGLLDVRRPTAEAPWFIRTGELDRPHRVVVFRASGARR